MPTSVRAPVPHKNLAEHLCRTCAYPHINTQSSPDCLQALMQRKCFISSHCFALFRELGRVHYTHSHPRASYSVHKADMQGKALATTGAEGRQDADGGRPQQGLCAHPSLCSCRFSVVPRAWHIQVVKFGTRWNFYSECFYP